MTYSSLKHVFTVSKSNEIKFELISLLHMNVELSCQPSLNLFITMLIK